MKNKRRLLFRLLTLAVIVTVAAVMFVIGRGHTIYFDNKTLEYSGETYSALQRVDIYVGGERIARLAKRERGMTTNIGQALRCRLEITENKGDEPVAEEVAFALPYNLDGIVINLPGYLAGLPQEAWQSEFVAQVTTEDEDEEEIVTDDFGIGEDL